MINAFISDSSKLTRDDHVSNACGIALLLSLHVEFNDAKDALKVVKAQNVEGLKRS